MSSVRTISRNRNAPGGLPTGPRSRSVGRDRDRDADYSAPAARPPLPAGRQVRPQRSLASIPAQSRSFSERAPPLPQSRAPTYDDRPRAHNDRRSDASSLASSSTSDASSASSFLGRMKVRSGESSSRTSWEEDAEPRGRTKGSWARERAQERPATPDNYVEEDDEPPLTPGHGSSLWTKVAAAANIMTISVSKAWATNITSQSGEETPPGQESRLTRAMKAYHLEKARDPSDLPEWLFEEHERRGGRPSTTRRRDDYEDDYADDRSTPPAPRSRGLKDIYEKAAASSSSSAYTRSEPDTRGRSRQTSVDDTSATPSKANDRLKALRDAKRGVVQRNASLGPEEPSGGGRERGREDREVERGTAEPRRPPPRQGLPTRPGRSGPQQRF
ncbi:hypothetical protein BV25DRAFT_270251 [Artomyces pyxidatus]|uniref:Uncharacterized protein n=1 Tax=Artomyces pyxidatus TaxID=48021 RepID=A0ACB8T7Y4_9AGAM|nr:hypothetical protein BV25DRAFT_270251 [Artomyces pyxidatus]